MELQLLQVLKLPQVMELLQDLELPQMAGLLQVLELILQVLQLLQVM
jgi:hypothetical protein